MNGYILQSYIKGEFYQRIENNLGCRKDREKLTEIT